MDCQFAISIIYCRQRQQKATKSSCRLKWLKWKRMTNSSLITSANSCPLKNIHLDKLTLTMMLAACSTPSPSQNPMDPPTAERNSHAVGFTRSVVVTCNTKKQNKLEIERSEGTLRGPRRPKMTNTQLQIQLRGIEQQLDSQGRSKSPWGSKYYHLFRFYLDC